MWGGHRRLAQRGRLLSNDPEHQHSVPPHAIPSSSHVFSPCPTSDVRREAYREESNIEFEHRVPGLGPAVDVFLYSVAPEAYHQAAAATRVLERSLRDSAHSDAAIRGVAPHGMAPPQSSGGLQCIVYMGASHGGCVGAMCALEQEIIRKGRQDIKRSFVQGRRHALRACCGSLSSHLACRRHRGPLTWRSAQGSPQSADGAHRGLRAFGLPGQASRSIRYLRLRSAARHTRMAF